RRPGRLGRVPGRTTGLRVLRAGADHCGQQGPRAGWRGGPAGAPLASRCPLLRRDAEHRRRSRRVSFLCPLLLQTHKLTKAYGRFRALAGLDLTSDRGEALGLLGPNGSGKTTALRLLLGFLRPTAGRATVAGHDCWHDSVAARRHVAYLPGELRLY